MGTRSSLLFGMLLFLSSCATAPPNQFVKFNPDSQSRINQIAHIGIIADVCLFKDVAGDNDYWVVQESRSAAGHMLQAAKAYLVGKGYDVSYVQAPFVGAFKDREKPFKVCEKNGGEVKEKTPPLFESEDLKHNRPFREALLKVIPKIPRSQSRQPSLPDTCCTTADMKDHISVIAESTGGDATLFLIGHGTIVSTGKQLTQGLATGLLTAVLTLGTASVVRYDASVMDTYAVLVDNTTGEILWSNVRRLKGDGFTDGAYYNVEKWPKTILQYMPEKAVRKESDEAEPTNNENPSHVKDTEVTNPTGN